MSKKAAIRWQIIVTIAVSFLVPVIFMSNQAYTLYFEKGNSFWVGGAFAAVFAVIMYFVAKKYDKANVLIDCAFAAIGGVAMAFFAS